MNFFLTMINILLRFRLSTCSFEPLELRKLLDESLRLKHTKRQGSLGTETTKLGDMGMPAVGSLPFLSFRDLVVSLWGLRRFRQEPEVDIYRFLDGVCAATSNLS